MINRQAEPAISTNPLLPKPAVIRAIRQETPDTATYTIELADPEARAAYRFRPGQFNMISLLGIGEAPISISSDPNYPETFDHTVRAVGSLTGAMTRLGVGEQLFIRGPYGNPWPVEQACGRDVLVVAGGIGLAPLRPLLTQIMAERHKYGRAQVCYGARTVGDLLFLSDYGRWSAEGGMDVLTTVDRLAPGETWEHQGLVTGLFAQLNFGDASRTVAFVCGPDLMMRFAVAGLLERGFSPQNIYLSLERRMECGVRICGRCQCGSAFVCHDGPVFRFDQIKALGGIYG